jgi:glycosyltransferase involved in cell wall biosynthesis
VAEGRRPGFLLILLAQAARLSGGDRHLLEMAARWQEVVDVSVLAPPSALATVREFLGDVEVHTLGSSPPVGPRLAIEYIRRGLVSFIRPLPRADVALAASHFIPDAAALAGLTRRGALGVGYVYHLIRGRPISDARTLWSRNDERVGLAILKRHADIVFASNDATAAALSRRGFHPVKTDVGIDLASFGVLTGAHNRKPSCGLFVGRLVASKGVRDAIRAWASVQAAVPEAKLVIAGEGPERSAAAALAHQLGIASAVEFVGFVSEQEKRRLLSESSVFVAPSYEEGWGIAVGEALASQIPVVAYQLETLDELFPSAYLAAPPGDHETLADFATKVLMDAALGQAIAHKGAETVARYDIDRVAASELETILQHRASRSVASPTTQPL